MWDICNIVDLYNCCSLLSLLPIGGYDLDKVSGDITIRYAKEGERFRGLGEKRSIEVMSNHVIYADDERVMCWLWNHKDAAETCIDTSTKYVLFFIDSVKTFEPNQVQNALDLLSGHLENIGCTPITSGILNKQNPAVELNVVR